MTPSERLVSTLPWMDNFSNIRSYDFDYTLDGSRVEVKGCKKATALPSGYDGITLQVSFGSIDPNKFDWLSCCHQDENQFWHILLLSSEQIRRGHLSTERNRITYVLGGRGKRPILNHALITYNALYKLCASDKPLIRTPLQMAFESIQIDPGNLRHQSILYR